MRSFYLMVNGFTDIMKQSGTLRHADIHTDLAGQKACQMGYFDGMLQCILTIAGTELHSSQKFYQLGMNSMDANLENGCLAFLADHGFHFLLRLLYHLFDAGRMDTSVHDKLFQRNPCHFAANGVKA